MKAGELSIDFVTNLAKLQGELSQIKRAIGQTMGDAVVSYNQLVRSADSMAASLERQAATHGKTAAQIREMDVAAKALALEEAGLTKEANRLKQANDALSQSLAHANDNHARLSSSGMILQHVMRSTTDSFAAGLPVSMIMGEQIARLGEAAALSGGSMGKFGAIMAGPWGLAITGGITVLSVLIPRLLGVGEASNKAAKAEDAHAEAAKRVKAALEQLDQAANNDITTERARILQAGRMVQALVEQEIQTKKLTKAKLEDALATYEITKASSVTGTHAGEVAAFRLPMQESQIAGLRSQITALNADLDKSAVRLRNASAFLVRDDVTRSFDKQAQAAAIYKSRVAELTLEYRKHNLTLEQYRADVNQAAAALQVVKDSDKVAAAAAREHRHELAEQAKAARQAAAEAKKTAAVFAEMNKLNLQPISAQMDKSIEKGWAEDWAETMKEVQEARKGFADAASAQVRANIEGDHEKLLASIEQFRSAASDLASAWGNVGRSIGDAMVILSEYGERQKKIDDLVANGRLTTQEGIKQSADLQLNSLIGITDAAKHLFSEHSKGYKAMAAAEKALTIIQLARTAVDVAGGAARMFASLGPLAFPAVGAMLAVMASLGFSGGGSGGSLPASNQGKGTTLGSSDTASASIKNSIEALGDVDRVTMGYSAQMAASLKSIESNIGGLASLLVRTGNISGATNGIQTGFKTSSTGKVLSGVLEPLQGLPIIGGIASAIGGVIKSLFGTKTSVIGSGIFGGSQNLASILSGGFNLQTYADIQKKKKFLGITTGTSTSTQYGAADSQVADQFGLILKSFYDAIGAAAVPLGKSTADVEHQLDSFVVSIGKIDFTGLSGDDIQKKLEAVFGAAADQMAAGAFPEIIKFQQVGEGAFQTLTRVANTVETVTSELTMLGLSSKSLGIDASMSIAGLFASVDAMKSATQSYFETYYTAEEQTAIKTRQLSDAFTSLGLTMPGSIAAYRALVDAQDLTTAAGQQTYAMLIQLAPAFAQISTAAQGATSAASIIRERQDLEKQLAQAEGDTAAVRQSELAALDPSNRALQQRIFDLQDEQAAVEAANAVSQERQGLMQQLWQLEGDTADQRAQQLAQLDPANRALQQQIFALQDQQAAAEAAAQAAQAAAQKTDALRQAWQSIGDTIEEEITRIRNLTGAGSSQGFASLLGQFNAATDAARHGDQSAAKNLPELSKEVLDAAATSATSRQELDRVQAQIAASLEKTLAMVNAATAASSAATASVLGPDTSAADAGNWWNSYAPAPSNDTADLRAEVEGLRSDLRISLSAIAGSTKKTATILNDVSNGAQTINTVAA